MKDQAMRVGYLMQNGAPDLGSISGPQLHVCAVIEGLQARGHSVRTVALQHGRLGWSDDLKERLSWAKDGGGAGWFRLTESLLRRTQCELQLPFLGLFDSVHYARTCTELLRDYDVLYERHGYMGYGGLIAARRLGIPLVVELNGNILREIEVRCLKMSTVQRQIGHWITCWTLRAANHVVVVSEALKRMVTQDLGVPAERVSVVLNGVNAETFGRSYDGALVRERFQLGPRRIVAFVGSFEPWHGVDLLVSSFGRLRPILSTTQLVLVGDGEGRRSVERQIDELGLTGHVRLLGRLPQEEVAAILSVTHVVVAPYPYEQCDILGTPLKLMEYMAAGKAIVATSTPIHELIADEVTGLRVAPARADALAHGILRLLEDHELRSRLEANARCVGREYTWERTARRLDEILTVVVRHREKQSRAAA
ncbi:MAG: glycosyltransferase family 4 protein [Acidobacteriota bacterium]